MEIEREGNIFFNLIKNETSLTEVFCNFMKYEIFRNLFIDLINEKIKKEENKIDKSIVEFQNFDTEVPLNDEQKNGRIDLQLKINSDIYLFEIKIETFTSLTNNQPNNYLKYLKNKNENLFFILPKGYFHKNEIFNRWYHLETENKYTKEDIENHNIIYWEDILKQIRKQELNKVDVFINEFCKILDYKWFYFEKIVFTENELNLIFRDEKEEGYKMLENTNVPVLMKKLFQIVVDTTDKISIQRRKDEQNSNYYGYFLNNSTYQISDKLTIWFGIDYEIWEIEKYPIIIQIETNKQKESLNLENFLKNKIEYTKFVYKNRDIIFYIPLEKEIFKNEDETITQKLTQKMEIVIDLLKEYNKE
jgi:hypothetical protein